MRWLLTLLLFPLAVGAQDFSAYERMYFDAPQLNLPYRYLRPRHTDSNARYPLVIFLHGALNKGFDNESQLAIGGRFFLRDSVRERYPAYVLFPQCPEKDLWAYFENRETTMKMEFPFLKKATAVSLVLMQLVDSLLRSDAIDPSRIYIGGLSQGGMGVLDLLARYPNRFAAGFSICGAGNWLTAKRFAGKASLWLFHGDADDVVPVEFSRNYCKQLQKAHADVLYSEYPGERHDSWSKAFAEKGLLSWIFSKKKS